MTAARKPLVYVAGPYSSDPVGNTRRAIEVGMDLWESHLVDVIIPHLTMLADLVRPMPYLKWLAFDQSLLVRCDAVLRLEGESNGADAEVALAAEYGIPVFEHVADLFGWVGNHWVAGQGVPA